MTNRQKRDCFVAPSFDKLRKTSLLAMTCIYVD